MLIKKQTLKRGTLLHSVALTVYIKWGVSVMILRPWPSVSGGTDVVPVSHCVNFSSSQQEEFFCCGISRSLDLILPGLHQGSSVHGHCEHECERQTGLPGGPWGQLH